MKQYDSSMDIICDDGTLRFRKVCDHCGKEFMAPRPNGPFGCTKCHDAHDRKMKQEYKDVAGRNGRLQNCLKRLQTTRRNT